MNGGKTSFAKNVAPGIDVRVEVTTPPRQEPTPAEIDALVTYHSPTPNMVSDINEVRRATAHLIKTIVRVCPPSADRSAAIRQVRTALMMANASIVLEGQSIT